MAGETNFQKLVQAGVIREPDRFSEEHKAAIASLTQQEVDAIISVKNKLGDEFLSANLPHGFFF
ncbi:MAG TPA: aroma-sacti cluster domain-containing protein [Bryobacteraceae bacterium]